jgi:polysaccharide deacetylase 2 family uncharacterized protein YibQ
MVRMTKLRYPEDIVTPAPKPKGGPGPAAFALALMFGVALALSADSTIGSRAAYQVAAQVTKSISDTLQALNTREREAIRLGEWPRRTLPGGPPPVMSDAPMIAIVIDDLGANVTRTNQAIALPANVTLSFLPDPPRSLQLSRRARLGGHEVMLHLPMQPSGRQNPGERALTTGLPPEELKQRLQWALSRVSDYDGVNNHMGSRFTESASDLTVVMRELKARNLFFLDSRTTAETQAQTIAEQLDVPTGRRDVFLDGQRNVAAIKRQLALAEDFARVHGSVIAIGHPHPETLQVLSVWSRTIRQRGFRLVPVRDVLRAREGRSSALLTAGISLQPQVKE